MNFNIFFSFEIVPRFLLFSLKSRITVLIYLSLFKTAVLDKKKNMQRMQKA